MIRPTLLHRATLLALVATPIAAPLAPAYGQATGLLGDSQVSDVKDAPKDKAADAPRKAPKSKKVTTIGAYLEVDQSAIWDIKGGSGDMLTYTTVAGGISATVESRNLAVGADIRLSHQFALQANQSDQTIISGLAATRIQLLPNILSVEGGAMATRVRMDGFTGANNSLIGADTSKVYSTYFGPTLTVPVGDLSINAAYRLGYNRVDNEIGSAIAAGLPVTGTFDRSWVHNITGSIGMQPGDLPFGWSVGGGYLRETASQLSQKYVQKFGRADVTVPISPTVALLGGVGYEKITISNKDALRDANGVVVRDSVGRFITDPNSARRLSYDSDGLIWDAGVMWRPGPHFEAEVHAGRRYGSMSYTGNLSWQPSRQTSINMVLFDNIDSFGRAINASLANLGTDFYVGRNPFSGDLGGCTFSTGQGAGACFTDTLTGIGAANYRTRGIFAQYQRRVTGWTFGVTGGYSNRKFISDNQSVLASVNGQADQNYYAALDVTHELDAVSGVGLMSYVNYFNAGIGGQQDVTQIGANMTYGRTLMRRLNMSAAVGIDSVDRQREQAFISLLAQIGMRYQF